MVYIITRVHFPILSSRSIWYYTFHLQELIGLIAPNNCKSKSHVALLQGCRQEGALQLGWVSRK